MRNAWSLQTERKKRDIANRKEQELALKAKKEKQELELKIENIQVGDLQSQIKESLKSGDFALALR